ncbi:hypothetical protein H6F95_05470 [Cyanobacteria bacterium FACHB-471]|nr:hypothetical protein [Cyanobacteria bacterium FACHB-471]
MAQIKVLNLGNSCSLSELSYEDTKAVNGGIVAGTYAAGYSHGKYNEYRLGDIGRAAFLGARIGAFAGPYFALGGASLSTPE